MKNRYGLPCSSPADFDVDRDCETKTTCPACKGCGKQEMRAVGPSMYSYVACASCAGEGMVTATQAKRISGTMRKVELR